MILKPSQNDISISKILIMEARLCYEIQLQQFLGQECGWGWMDGWMSEGVRWGGRKNNKQMVVEGTALYHDLWSYLSLWECAWFVTLIVFIIIIIIIVLPKHWSKGGHCTFPRWWAREESTIKMLWIILSIITLALPCLALPCLVSLPP